MTKTQRQILDEMAQANRQESKRRVKTVGSFVEVTQHKKEAKTGYVVKVQYDPGKREARITVQICDADLKRTNRFITMREGSVAWTPTPDEIDEQIEETHRRNLELKESQHACHGTDCHSLYKYNIPSPKAGLGGRLG